MKQRATLTSAAPPLEPAIAGFEGLPGNVPRTGMRLFTVSSDRHEAGCLKT